MKWADQTKKEHLKEIKKYTKLPKLQSGYVYVTDLGYIGWLGVHGEELSTFRITLFDNMEDVKANKQYAADISQHKWCFKGYKYYKLRKTPR